MTLEDFNKKIGKYIPIIGIGSVLLSLLAITGFTWNVPQWIKALETRSLVWFLFAVNFAFTLIILIIISSRKKNK